MKVQHLIPLTDDGASPSLKAAEAFTLRTVRDASIATSHDVTVSLLGYAGSRKGENFGLAPESAVLEVASRLKVRSSGQLALPSLRNVLGQADKSHEVTVFSNPDISLQRTFYDEIGKLSSHGLAGSITRRTIHGSPAAKKPLFFPRLQYGKYHPGHDCFFFPSNIVTDFFVGEVFLGAPPVGEIMLLNIALAHRETIIFSERKLTFHFGDDRPWSRPERESLLLMNMEAAREATQYLVDFHGGDRVRDVSERLKLRRLIGLIGT